MIACRGIRFLKSGNRLALRAMSSQISQEELTAGLEKVEKFRKFQQQTGIEFMATLAQFIRKSNVTSVALFFCKCSVLPKTMTDVLGTGIELHLPKNPAEMAVVSGMPSEHANRTVNFVYIVYLYI